VAETLAGARVVVNVANSPSFEDKAALEFFEHRGATCCPRKSPPVTPVPEETQLSEDARFGISSPKTAKRERMGTLSEKVVIVTGGSSGIGRAAALGFARQGAKVLITARRAGPLDETVAEHANIVGLVADAAATADAVRAVAKAVDTWGRLDALVNNAGAGAILPLADATADRIMKIFAVNVLGPSLLAAAALPFWRQQGERSSMFRAPSVTSRWPGARCDCVHPY
jgi:NADPH:quinone reductase-like Zn-dependent oxidoreductase